MKRYDMKRTVALALLLGLAMGLLLPSLVIEVDNKMVLGNGPGGGGGGGGKPEPPASEIVYYMDSPEDKWAVIIGITDYDGQSSDLMNPHNDALEMKDILEAYGYNYALALDGAATSDNFDVLMDWLIVNEGPDSEVVFFFSGHGARTQDGSWDSDTETDGYDECIVSWDLYAITDAYMTSKFAELESNRFAAIYCSCHSGGMFDQTYEVRSGGLYIAAAEADQYGWDYGELQNTLFFYYFGDQGLLNGPYDNAQDAFWYARPLVINEQPDSCPIMLDNIGTPFYVK